MIFDGLNKKSILYKVWDQISRLGRAWADDQRKSAPRFIYEYSLFTIRKRDVSRYISSLLYRRHVKNPYAYLSISEYFRLYELAALTRPELIELLADKYKFHRHFENSGIPIPKYLGRFSDGHWHDNKGGITQIADAGKLSQHLLKLMGETGSAIFAKDRNGIKGKGAVKIAEHSDFDDLYRRFIHREYIFQEDLMQHRVLKAVFPRSLNTIRFITCMGKDGVARIGCARIRFGMGRNVVDNGASGGFFAGIDLKTGRVSTIGMKAQDKGGESFIRHPDTKHEILGLELPMFQETLEVVLAAANHLPFPLVGWDVGLGTDGPVLIEGNHNPLYYNDEIASGAYRENPVLGPFIDELTAGRGL